MNRAARIHTYRERSLDRAALIAALSSARPDDPALDELKDRQDAQLDDLLHEFAFGARKLLELVEREQCHSSSYARRQTVFCSREADAVEMFDMPMLSLWEVLGIIHSDRLDVRRGQVPRRDGSLREESAWGFNVASDRDKPGTHHFVFIEFLLTEFLAFNRELDRDLRRAGD